MSFFEPQPWGGAPARQPSWEQQVPPSRSGATSASSNEPTAFLAQLEEVDRAIDNLVKSGKLYPGMPGAQSFQGMPSRRDSMPVLGRQYGEYDSRSGGSSRHHSISEYDGGRSGSSAGLQGYYAGQRFPPRPNEQDRAMQAKRRLAAQRERELRNYHQEQQYNKNSSAAVKSDRSLSPTTLNEDDRRDLIQRQHRALYGNESAMYHADGSGRPSQDARLSISGNPRGPSPLAFDPFSVQQQTGPEGPVQMPSRDQVLSGERRTSTSPTSASRSNFGLDSAPHSAGGNTATSPTTSPSIGSGNIPSIATQSGVAPIGTRPIQQVGGAKRAATPNERSTSAASNPTAGNDRASGLGWGTSSGGWGHSKNTLGVQASVWG
ncbi:Hypothetical protein D9617_7g029920 [Elsinoe fawcettii]|nr:Hypothetical protein D9617_7g029920 [Elsinoe fawcettii]